MTTQKKVREFINTKLTDLLGYTPDVKFNIMEDPAFYSPLTDIICLHKGRIKEYNFETLCFLLLHEVSHQLRREYLLNDPSSKYEEFQADIIAIYLFNSLNLDSSKCDYLNNKYNHEIDWYLWCDDVHLPGHLRKALFNKLITEDDIINIAEYSLQTDIY